MTRSSRSNLLALAALTALGLSACHSLAPGLSLQDVVAGRAALRKDGPGTRTPDLPGSSVRTVCNLMPPGVTTCWRSDPYVTRMTLSKSSIEFTGIEYPTNRRRSQYRWKVEVPTDYRPTAVAARSADDYDVAGERPWGGLRLERRQLASIPLGFAVTRSIA